MPSAPEKTALVLLAAGRGLRMEDHLKTPKPLPPFCGEPLLQRTLRQFHEIGLDDLYVVTGHRAEETEAHARATFPGTRMIHNPRYREDRNIYSLLLALEHIPEAYGVLVVEGDVVLADPVLPSLGALPGLGGNFWVANGHFRPHQKGGILDMGDQNRLLEIRYSDYEDALAGWYKNLGVLYLDPGYRRTYQNLLESYAEHSLDVYFMTPWQEHLAELPARVWDVGEEFGASFNTPEEYDRAKRLMEPASAVMPVMELVPVDRLKHIEAFDEQRVSWLAEKIRSENVWTTPLTVSREHYLVMDGQHRMEAALRLGLKRVPAFVLEYASVPVYSLRPDFVVTVDDIIRRALCGNIYPYKTAKHILPRFASCHIPLGDLS